MKALNNIRQDGFTILELMIATSVLSVVLLLATAVMINIGDIYYKGNSQALIQDSTRNAADQLTSDIQLSANAAQPTAVNLQEYGYGGSSYVAYAYCVVAPHYTVRYTFVTQLQRNPGGAYTASPPQASQIPHVLWRDLIPPGSNCYPADLVNSQPSQPTPVSATPTNLTTTTGQSFTFLNGIQDTGEDMVPPGGRLLNFCIASASSVYPAGGACSTPSTGYATNVSMAYGSWDLLTSLLPGGLCTGGAGDRFCATDNLTTAVTPRLGQ